MSKVSKEKCSYCGTHFSSIFEETDHLVPAGKESFNPSIVLPGGYHLKVGTLLRYIYANRANPNRVSSIVQGAYATLLDAEKHLA